MSFLLIQGSIGLWPTFDTTKRGYLLLSTTRIFFQYTVPLAHFFFRIRPRNFIEKICFSPLRQFRSTGRRGSPSFSKLLQAPPSYDLSYHFSTSLVPIDFDSTRFFLALEQLAINKYRSFLPNESTRLRLCTLF